MSDNNELVFTSICYLPTPNFTSTVLIEPSVGFKILLNSGCCNTSIKYSELVTNW